MTTTEQTSLTEVFADVLVRKLKMSKAVADLLAAELVVGAAELGHGGVSYHLHTLDYLTREDVSDRVRREYNGRNVSDLCRRYGRSRSTIYRYLRRGESDQHQRDEASAEKLAEKVS